MNTIKRYMQVLSEQTEWEDYLLRESRLPGPRANLELVTAVANTGNEQRFRQFLAYPADQSLANTPGEFLIVCGVVGLGQLIADGAHDLFAELRLWASDDRWRVREAVAMGLQRVGMINMPLLLDEMRQWVEGDFLEQRAAAAALCEPALLTHADDARQVLAVLDAITQKVAQAEVRKSEAFKVLRKGLAYCWSVAVVAAPDEGKRLMENWFASPDPDVHWIIRENLKKQRLTRMDADWVKRWQARLEA